MSGISRSLFFILTISIIFACGCKKAEMVAPHPKSVSDKALQASSPASESSSVQPPTPPGEGGTAAQSPQKTVQRKVIMTHSLTLEVKDSVAAIRQLSSIAEKSGGFVFSSNSRKDSDGVVRGDIGIRIPSGRIGNVLEQVRSVGKVAAEQANADDITEGYVDLEARMKNAKASEARIVELLRQAGKLSDVLMVEKELTRIRGEIEAFETRKRNWDLQLEMTSIKIELTDKAGKLPSLQRFWRPLGSSFGEALEGFARSMAAMIIFVGVMLPWVAILLPASIFIWKRIARWREARRLKKEAPRMDPGSGSG